MIRNYIKVAIRHLLRNKGITAINVAGLAIGMACCILIVLFIQKRPQGLFALKGRVID